MFLLRKLIPPTPPGRRSSAPSPAPTVPTLPPSHIRYLAQACKVGPTAAPPQRQYTHKLSRGGGIRLGLGPSDIPSAGWGVFALSTIKVGSIVLDYSGLPRTKEWVENPLNDARYVWGDENELDALASPSISTLTQRSVQADGFHRGAHLRDYWQAHYQNLSVTTI